MKETFLGGIHLSCFQMATPWTPGKNANFMIGWWGVARGCLLFPNEIGSNPKNFLVINLVASVLPWSTIACMEDAIMSVNTHQLLAEQ